MNFTALPCRPRSAYAAFCSFAPVILACLILSSGCGKPEEPRQQPPASAARKPWSNVEEQEAAAKTNTPPPPPAAQTADAPETNEPPPPSLDEQEKLLTTNALAVINRSVVPVDEFVKVFANDQLDKLPGYLRREVDQNRLRFINQLIDNEVLATAAAEEDFSSNPEYERELHDALRQLQIRYYYERHVAAAATVQDQDVKEYYLVHKQEYTAPERVRARHILVSVKRGAYPAEVSNAWNKASLLRRRVLEGEPFSEVARQESDCPSRDNGGDLGYFEPGQMVPAFTDKVFKLKQNEVSDVIQTEFGYHIAQLIDRIPGRSRSFEEVRDEIRQRLVQEREQLRYGEVLASLTNRIKVLRNEKLIRNLVSP